MTQNVELRDAIRKINDELEQARRSGNLSGLLKLLAGLLF